MKGTEYWNCTLTHYSQRLVARSATTRGTPRSLAREFCRGCIYSVCVCVCVCVCVSASKGAPVAGSSSSSSSSCPSRQPSGRRREKSPTADLENVLHVRESSWAARHRHRRSPRSFFLVSSAHVRRERALGGGGGLHSESVENLSVPWALVWHAPPSYDTGHMMMATHTRTHTHALANDMTCSR